MFDALCVHSHEYLAVDRALRMSSCMHLHHFRYSGMDKQVKGIRNRLRLTLDVEHYEEWWMER